MRTKKRKQKVNIGTVGAKIQDFIKKGWYQVERQLHRPKNEHKQSSNSNFNYTKLITTLVIGIFIFLVILWLLGAFHNVMLQTKSKNYNLFTNGLDLDKAGLAGLNIFKTQLKPMEILEVFAASLIIG